MQHNFRKVTALGYSKTLQNINLMGVLRGDKVAETPQ